MSAPPAHAAAVGPALCPRWALAFFPPARGGVGEGRPCCCWRPETAFPPCRSPSDPCSLPSPPSLRRSVFPSVPHSLPLSVPPSLPPSLPPFQRPSCVHPPRSGSHLSISACLPPAWSGQHPGFVWDLGGACSRQVLHADGGEGGRGTGGRVTVERRHRGGEPPEGEQARTLPGPGVSGHGGLQPAAQCRTRWCCWRSWWGWGWGWCVWVCGGVVVWVCRGVRVCGCVCARRVGEWGGASGGGRVVEKHESSAGAAPRA